MILIPSIMSATFNIQLVGRLLDTVFIGALSGMYFYI